MSGNQITYNKQSGFTLVEMLVIVAITVMLSVFVTVNFSELRASQELSSAATDFISKAREVQNYIFTGFVVAGGEKADAYEIRIAANTTSYQIYYEIDSVLSLLETVNLPANMRINQIKVGGAATTPVTIRMTSPFGNITVNGSPSQLTEVELVQSTSGRTKAVVIDPISGRIGLK